MPRSDKKEILDSHLKSIEAFAGLGLTNKEIAHILGISEARFYDRIKEKPEIAESIERGKATAKNNLLAKAYNKSIGKGANDLNSGDNDMLRWTLARVHGMSEKKILEHRDGDNLKNKSKEELEKLLQEMEAEQNESES
ncbi:MAG: hypothetical protein KC483_10895 [Nitrosarchaeum sp.]|nr:hypothetical protein [Nitrosarchaeum sp.]